MAASTGDRSEATSATRVGEEERVALRDALRRMLEREWRGADGAAAPGSAGDTAGIVVHLADQGLMAIGSSDGFGGPLELALAMEELGRAACPIPLHGVYLSNRVIEGVTTSSVAATWIADLRAGRLSLGSACPLNGDEEGSTLRVGSDGFRGRVRYAELSPDARVLAVLFEEAHRLRLAIFELPGSNVTVTLAPGFGRIALHDVTFDGAKPLATFDADAVDAEEVGSAIRLCLASRALGAAARGFEMANEYALERRQFGRQIGSFQAIQHKLASGHIALQGLRQSIAYAASIAEQGIDGWTFAATAAFAYAADVLPNVMLDIQHTFGAIGYAEEHEAPRHFRRVHVDMLRCGGRTRARQELARHALASGRLPDRIVEPDVASFAAEVRTWLDEHWNAARKAQQRALPFSVRDRDFAFGAEVGDRGWTALTWPERFGGLALPVRFQAVLVAEMERVGAPRFGAPIQAAAIMAFGTPAQQEEHLSRIRRGDTLYGIGYSEPGSGSDLASVQTSAARDGDEWILNGQKIWTTTWWGQYMWVLARTNPIAKPPHAGLSLFLFPMDTPGITVVPCAAMYDGTFANVFYDNVRLPASALLGAVDGAWNVLHLALAVERAVVGGAILARVNVSFDELCQALTARPDPADALTLDLLGAYAARIVVGQALAERSASSVEDGVAGLVQAAVCKVFCSELMEQFFEDAVRHGGVAMALSESAADAPFDGQFEQRLRHSLMHVISGGTNDIQRNVIALRGLGLPREPR